MYFKKPTQTPFQGHLNFEPQLCVKLECIFKRSTINILIKWQMTGVPYQVTAGSTGVLL